MCITSLKSILIHTGVNDTDDTCGTKVGEKLFTIINKIQAKFPGIKIIVSEVTPRMDGKDSEVKKCNNVINQYAKRREGIYIAAHSNLRDQRFFRDNKHIKEIKIAKFAANLKRALRNASTTQVTAYPDQIDPTSPSLSRETVMNSANNTDNQEDLSCNMTNPLLDQNERSSSSINSQSENLRNIVHSSSSSTRVCDESGSSSQLCANTGGPTINDTVDTHSTTNMRVSDIEAIFPGFQEKLISAFTQSLGMMFGT